MHHIDLNTDLAVAWLLSRSGVTSPVIGPRTIEQLTVVRSGRRPASVRETPPAGQIRYNEPTEPAGGSGSGGPAGTDRPDRPPFGIRLA
jgi:hypothetical protein